MESRSLRSFTPRVRPELLVGAEEVERIRNDLSSRLFDARKTDRYRGENETIDQVAGHIPGAISLPYAENLNSDGLFLPTEQLKARFVPHLGDVPVEKTVVYCGSGVTATHNVLAMAHAGLGEARLYAGSWSEWITDRRRLVAKGSGRC